MLSMEIYAHRGASKYAPENTMSAFELAYEQGATGIETDVHLTSDHVPVLIHDEKLDRTTNGKGFIKDHTYKEVKKLNAGSWFAEEFKQESIISLETFLQWVTRKNLALNIELKNHKIYYDNIELIVYNLLEKYGLLERTIISTFNPSSIEKLKEFPSVQCALLRSRWKRNLVQYAFDLGAHALHINYRLLNLSLIKQAKQLNMPVRVYTVNSKRRMIRCIRYQCDAIITDVPNLCLQYLNK